MPVQPEGRFHYLPVPDRMLDCELYLTSLGWIAYPPGSEYPSGSHPKEYDFNWESGRRLSDFALVWLSQGNGEAELAKGEVGPFTPGMAILLSPGHWHRYRPDPISGWTENWICMNGEHLHRLRIRGFLPSGNNQLEANGIPDWQFAFQKLLKEVLGSPESNQPLWGAQALQILHQATSRTGSSVMENPGDPLVHRALRLIRQQAHRPLSVDRLAGLLSTSRRTLERHFSQTHTRSPQEEILHVRLTRASRMLGDPEIPIKEIAYACGFSSPKLMNHHFGRILGKSPGALRRELVQRQMALGR